MTTLTRPVCRKVPAGRDSALVVTLTAIGIVFREPRRRASFILPYGVAFQRAVTLHVDAERRAKREARKARRSA